MFRGYSGPYSCEVDELAHGFVWRVVLTNDPEQHLAAGSCATMDEAIRDAYRALSELKGQIAAE